MYCTNSHRTLFYQQLKMQKPLPSPEQFIKRELALPINTGINVERVTEVSWNFRGAYKNTLIELNNKMGNGETYRFKISNISLGGYLSDMVKRHKLQLEVHARTLDKQPWAYVTKKGEASEDVAH